MLQTIRVYKTGNILKKEYRVHACAACRAVDELRNAVDNYFQGNVSLFEKSFLNIKVSLSEDTLDNFKVEGLRRREVFFLCFVQLFSSPLWSTR